jgi:hypothetical protein
MVRARKLCSKYAELYGPGVSTTTLDWDGSAGILWDFDRYDLTKWTFGDTMEYRFGVDTILNWIYPEIIIIEEEVRK